MMTMLLLMILLDGDQRGQRPINRARPPELISRERYALLIGVSNYRNESYWPSLPGVCHQMISLRKVLLTHGFKVEACYDPDLVQLKQAFSNFIARHGQDSAKELLVFFAVHGVTHKGKGYIVPADASGVVEGEHPTHLMALQEIAALARDSIEATHALFIFDSCFAGQIMNYRSSPTVPIDLAIRSSRMSRQIITSGGVDEPVLEPSVFGELLVKALSGFLPEADIMPDGYLTASELGLFLKATVPRETDGRQNPLSGSLVGFSEGEFIFDLDKLSPAPSQSSKRFLSTRPIYKNKTWRGFAQGRDLPIRILVKPTSVHQVELFENLRIVATHRGCHRSHKLERQGDSWLFKGVIPKDEIEALKVSFRFSFFTNDCDYWMDTRFYETVIIPRAIHP